MHVFLTGGSGWVGSRVAQVLLSHGHTVTGLARSPTSANKLSTAGLTPLLGAVADTEILTQGAQSADAVIHCAFDHDFSQIATTMQNELIALHTLGDALAGTGKTLIVTSGLYGAKAPGDASLVLETDEGLPDDHQSRVAMERIVLAYKDKGVKAMVVRLPPSCHGKGDRGFASYLIELARTKKESAFVEEGYGWSATHVEDVARLYVDVLEKGEAGQRYHAVGEEDGAVPFREFAAAVGEGLGVPVVAKTKEEVGYFGWMAPFMGNNIAGSGEWTRDQLGWAPKEIGWIDDIKQNYF